MIGSSNRKKIKPLGIITLLLLLGSSSFLAWSKYQKQVPKLSVAIKMKNDVPVITILDTAVLETFQSVSEHMDSNREEFLLIGYLNATDGADSSQRIDHATYIFSKKASLYYFRLGEIEVFNSKTMSIYIDHENKKVMLGPSKDVVPSTMIPDFKHLVASVADEGYIVGNSLDRGTEIITLNNPNHVTCKQYSIRFNASTLFPTQLHLRLSNEGTPEDGSLDKVIDFSFSKTAKKSNINKYLGKKIVVKKNDTWKLDQEFEGYELINTLNL